jgi:hypothetical protein
LTLVREGESELLAGTLRRLAFFAVLPLLSATCAEAQVIDEVIDRVPVVGEVLPPVSEVIPPVGGVVPPVTNVLPPVGGVVAPINNVLPPIPLALPVIEIPEGGLPIVRLPLPGCTGDIATCLPGTVLNLAQLPSGIIDLVQALPGEATGLLLQETAALSQVVSGLTGTIASNLTNVVLDLGLIDAVVGGPGGGGVVSSPLVVSAPASPLSMFMVSGVKSLSHDGFDTTSLLGNGTTPAYDETDYGLTLGVRWDASSHFDLAPNSLTFGVIGNYTHTDLDFGTNAALAPFLDKSGQADVDSWSVGTFGLVTDGRKYGLLTLNATFGSPDTENFALASTAEYNTFGIAASAISGVLIPVGGATLDLRGGLTFISASGDDYTDSAGVHFRDAELEEISGELSARLFQVVRFESGTLRPFIQGGLSQRLHYSNEVEVEGVTFSFEDADTTVFARAGVDFEIDRSLQAYLAVRGDVNESLEAITGQVGLTFKID